MPNQTETFNIGLCMAGAISAGAYTAGVVDYLIEALDTWQKRKDTNEENTPTHNVVISCIGGASAGGMTGMITAAAILDQITPVQKLEGNILTANPNNKFYHSWVDLVQDEMFPVLLDTTDLVELKSLLNSTFIDTIAERALKVSNGEVRRKYIAENLKLFVTLSNLEGMKMSVDFKSGENTFNKYITTKHNDYGCFTLSENYNNDGWIPLNFKTGLNTNIAKQAAMATGAFPVGLKARELHRDGQYINELNWFSTITGGDKNFFPDTVYKTVNVDGGMINNEPFEKVMELLKEGMLETEKTEMQNYNSFKGTVLMIDPFPSEPEKFNAETNLTNVISNTLGAMLNQARVKPSALKEAMDPNKAGQFLIAPVRYKKTGNTEIHIGGKKAIACGALGGFGGFISKEFRIHDYFLGRANCEKFLRHYFTVPDDTTHPLFVNGYSEITDKTKFKASNGRLQIIPIFTNEHHKPYMPAFANKTEWPSITQNQIKSYRDLIKKRVEKVLFKIADYSNMQRLLLWIGAKVVLNGKIADATIDVINQSLKEHELLDKK